MPDRHVLQGFISADFCDFLIILCPPGSTIINVSNFKEKHGLIQPLEDENAKKLRKYADVKNFFRFHERDCDFM